MRITSMHRTSLRALLFWLAAAMLLAGGSQPLLTRAALPEGSRFALPEGSSSDSVTSGLQRPNLAPADEVYSCFAQIDGHSTIYKSADVQAVQEAVDAATPGDLVKVAGTCAGVTSAGGTTQSVRIEKSLTLQGGYNSDFSFDPDNALTTIDAQQGGRVLSIVGNIDVTLNNLRVTGGLSSAGEDGGGIFIDTATVIINTSEIFGNATGNGRNAVDPQSGDVESGLFFLEELLLLLADALGDEFPATEVLALIEGFFSTDLSEDELLTLIEGVVINDAAEAQLFALLESLATDAVIEAQLLALSEAIADADLSEEEFQALFQNILTDDLIEVRVRELRESLPDTNLTEEEFLTLIRNILTDDLIEARIGELLETGSTGSGTDSSGQGGNSGHGGGIANAGRLIVTDSAVYANSTGDGGRGIIQGGSSGSGGGIATTGVLTVTNSIIRDNSTGRGSSGLLSGGNSGDGGGIANLAGQLTLTDSIVRNNTTGTSGFGLAIGIPGDGGGIAHGAIDLTADLEVRDSTIAGNRTGHGFIIGGFGGGIYSIANADEANATISIDLTNTVVRDNATGRGIQAFGAGGGVYTVALSDRGDARATTTLTASSVSGNNAGMESTTTNVEEGGGIANIAVADENNALATLVLTNSTVSGNTSVNGGGVVNTAAFEASAHAVTELVNSTVSDNRGSNGGGLASRAINNGRAEITLANSLVAAQASGTDCAREGGTILSNGHNLDSDNSCELTAAGDRPGTDPRLGPLQVNGPGTTATHALLPDSPAIDGVIDPARCTVTTDQRGVTRPQGPLCDIGAYEAEATETATPTPTATPEPTATRTPYVEPDFQACPADTWPLGTFAGTLRRDRPPRAQTYTVPLAFEAQVTVLGYAREGHPEACPGGATCGQGQLHEEFAVGINGVVVGTHTDQGDIDAWLPLGPWQTPAVLPAGELELTVAHLLQGTTPESVSYKLTVCAEPAAQAPVLPAEPGRDPDTLLLRAEGGHLETSDGNVRITFPAGAVVDSAMITYTALDRPDWPLPAGQVVVHSFALDASVVAGPPITRFDQPYQLVITYTDAELETLGAGADDLVVVFWDAARERWSKAASTVDVTTNQVTLLLDRATTFTVIVEQRPHVFLPIMMR